MIDLYTAATPNGWKVAIALEELGLEYAVHSLDLSAGDHKKADYLAINPNGKIPAIVDQDAPAGPLTIFESGAILIHLAERTGKLLPADPAGQSRVVQWLMFQMSGLGPMMGQAGVFYRYASEKIPFAIDRYQREVRRLLEVMDNQLTNLDHIAGDHSIADIALYPWAMSHDFVGVAADGLDHLARWLARMAARPAVQRGIAIPKAVDFSAIDKDEIESRRKNLT
jgi:GST-like protein